MNAFNLTRAAARGPARAALAVLCAMFVSACSLVPREDRPAFDVPARYAEAEASPQPALQAGEAAGTWKPAEPADGAVPSPWWNLFADATLVQLQEQALAAGPDAAIAMARIQQARALTARSQAARFPALDAGFGPTRQRSSGTELGDGHGSAGSTQTLWRAQAQVAYEVDLFGRVSAGVAAAHADAGQQSALAQQMLLLVQADVARTYFSLRQLQAERALLRETVGLRESAVRILQERLDAGAVAPSLADQARTELLDTQAELSALEQQHALTTHALAVLLGQVPASFALQVEDIGATTVQIPAGLPSALLERRPDIAAAERAMAADNARIGVARAAFFPSLSLTGSAGYASSELGNLTRWTQRTFLLGPLVGTALNLPLFDGGKRRAGVALAHARHDERVAEYRRTVLRAFAEVEDALVSIRTLDERQAYAWDAGQTSARVAAAARARFDNGDADYLLVVDAERTHLRSRQALIQAEGERARATVDLVRALGGGWDARTAGLSSAAR